ncbi:MAG: hypothetical protein Q8891_14810 [Bacteroidota bacterium]|nr:hypothetical protein [Bacteroidota bacterium]
MKIEQVLVQYLLENKHLNLQRIGHFQIDASIPDTVNPEKPFIIPEGAITFQYDPKAPEDDDLVNYIVQQTKKIKPLASSDLDSFLSLGREFLNIGKPFTIPNMGTIDKTNSGELTFVGGQLIATRLEPLRIKIEDEGAEPHEENMFNDYQTTPKTSGNKKGIIMVVFLLVIGLIAWALWHYGFKKNNQANISTSESVVPVTDTVSSNPGTTATDTLTDKKTENSRYTFKIVVNEFTNELSALKRFTNLKSYHRNVIMYTNDSITYKIAEPFTLPLSDTTRVLDSLNNYYTKDKTKLEY